MVLNRQNHNASLSYFLVVVIVLQLFFCISMSAFAVSEKNVRQRSNAELRSVIVYLA